MGGYILTQSGATVYFDGKSVSFDKSRKDYEELVNLLYEEKWQEIFDRLSSKKLKDDLNQKFAGTGVVVGDEVYFNGEQVHNVVCDRIVEATKSGRNPENLVNFLTKLQQNPSNLSVKNLYEFLEYNAHPITKDGCFIAYKRVRDNYKDIYTGTIDNSVGQVVSMARNKVEDNPNKTCAAGLHVAALPYARDDYGNGMGRLVVCKVSPADVVSVPTDYSHQKMRVCRYEVLEELKDHYKPWDQDYVDDYEKDEGCGFDKEDDTDFLDALNELEEE